MAAIALLILYLSKSFIVEAQPVQYNLAHVTNGACSGPLPTVEFSLRSSIDGDDNIPQEFTEWSLVQYYTGNCNQDQTLITNQPTPGTKYQFRVEMTPASSCHCVSLTSITQPFGSVLTAWENGDFWCGNSQPLLCAADDKVSRFLSRVVTVTDNSIAACDSNHLSSYNTTSLAVAYDGVFGTCPETQQQCFPLSPLQQNNAHVEIDFSLILNLNIGPNCRSLCNANEGILLRADSSISTAYLNFYYDKQKRGNGGKRIPQLHFIDGGRVSLSYDNNVTFIKVPGTFNEAIGLQMYNVSSSLIVNRVVRIKWEQHTQTPSHRGDCDTVSLDSTAVSLNWNQCVRNVLDEDFNDQQAIVDWDLFQVNVSESSEFCLDSYPCLYFVEVNRTTNTSDLRNVRFSSSPLLDLRIVKAVKPPPATIPTIMNSTKCSDDQKLLTMTFQLVMTQFRYPTPCNEHDNTPKGVVMTVSNTPLAYFAPLAHDNWSQFTRESMLYNIDGIDVPIMSPVHNRVTKVSQCIDDEAFLEVAWRQDSFTSNQNYWYLHIEQLVVDDIEISNINQAGGDNYDLSLTNDGNLNPTSCIVFSTCSFFGLTGSDSQSPRAVTITVTLTTASSSLSPTMSSSHSMSTTTVAIIPTIAVASVTDSSFSTISAISTVAVINSSISSGSTLSSSSSVYTFSSTVVIDSTISPTSNAVVAVNSSSSLTASSTSQASALVNPSVTSVTFVVNTLLPAISSTAVYKSLSTSTVNPMIPSPTASLESTTTASPLPTSIDLSTTSQTSNNVTALPVGTGGIEMEVVVLIVVFVAVGVVLLIVLILIALISILKYKQRKSLPAVQQDPVLLEKVPNDSESCYPAMNLDEKSNEAETKLSGEKEVESDVDEQLSPSKQSSPSHNSTVPLMKPPRDVDSVLETGSVHSSDEYPTRKYPTKLQVIPSRTDVDSPVTARSLILADSENESEEDTDEISYCSHEDQLVYISFSNDDDDGMQKQKLHSKAVSCSHSHTDGHKQ